MPPIYQFVCEECERHFETLCKADEVKDQKCVSCGSENVWKAVSAHGTYHIKGDNSASTRPRHG